jgi:hypothetical protein
MTEEARIRGETVATLDEYFRTSYKLHMVQPLKNIIGRKITDYNVSSFLYDLCGSKTIDDTIKKDVIERIFPHIVESNKKEAINFSFMPKKIPFYETLLAQDKIEKLGFSDVGIDQIDVELFLNPKCVVSFNVRNSIDVIKKNPAIVDKEKFMLLKLNAELQKRILLALLFMNDMVRFERLRVAWKIDFTFNVKEFCDMELNEFVIRYLFEKKTIKMLYVKCAATASLEHFLIFYQYVKYHNIEEQNIVTHLKGSSYNKMCKSLQLFT